MLALETNFLKFCRKQSALFFWFFIHGAMNKGFITLQSKVQKFCDFAGQSLHFFLGGGRSKVYIAFLRFWSKYLKSGEKVQCSIRFFAFLEKILRKSMLFQISTALCWSLFKKKIFQGDGTYNWPAIYKGLWRVLIDKLITWLNHDLPRHRCAALTVRAKQNYQKTDYVTISSDMNFSPYPLSGYFTAFWDSDIMSLVTNKHFLWDIYLA